MHTRVRLLLTPIALILVLHSSTLFAQQASPETNLADRTASIQQLLVSLEAEMRTLRSELAYADQVRNADALRTSRDTMALAFQRINSIEAELLALAALAAELKTEALTPLEEGAEDVPQPPDRNATARTDSLVSAALTAAPGLPEAGSAQWQALRDLLLDGACATDALNTVFGSINRLTLLALIETLGPC